VILEPAGLEQLSEITALHLAYDVGWFGEVEHDVDEVREWFELGDRHCVVRDGDRVVAVGNAWRTGSNLVIDPAADGPAAARLGVDWLRQVAVPATEVLDRDTELRDVLIAAGWRYAYSTFELCRAVEPAWERPAPSWPAGVRVRPLEPGEEPALHELIYREAGWADVPGHHEREFEEWRSIFIRGDRAPDRPLLAVRDDRLVGAALPRLFSDGTGWIAQLAVARAERGRGIGRALLLAGLDVLTRGGATKLGLGVLGENRSALRLYQDVGLRLDREWQTFAAPA
jgi:ribosomal protein S18 acetylase RimI-like enzyme